MGEPYETKAKAAKLEYESALEEYRKSDSYAAAQAAIAEAKAVAKSSPAKSKGDHGTPEKKGKGDRGTPNKTALPAAKRVRKGSHDEACIEIDEATIQAAGELAGALRNLAARPEAKGKSHDAILKALQENGGLVNKAKQALASV